MMKLLTQQTKQWLNGNKALEREFLEYHGVGFGGFGGGICRR